VSTEDADPAVAAFFMVTIDEQRYSLGSFTACDGIGCEVVIEQREEGGNNAFVHQLPGRVKYSNVKLTRAVGPDTAKIANWFALLAANDSDTIDVKGRPTAHIVAMTAAGTPVWTWVLMGVVPVRWTGPSFSVDTAKVSLETLELAHHGFMKQNSPASR